MVIQQLIYWSTAVRPLEAEELEKLVSRARSYNHRQAITGLLFYAGQRFFQVLEGEPSAVLRLYEHIGRDPRHTHLTTILNEPAPRRLFPNWDLGFHHVCPAALTRLAGYLDPRFRAALLPSNYTAQEVITDLLHEFVLEHAASTTPPPGTPWR